MAKNTVKVDVKVDDKGSTKKVELGAKKASKALDGAGKSARTVNRNIKGAAQTATAGGKNFSKMSQGMGGLVAGYATLAAQIFAISAAFNFLKSAGDLTSLKAGQQAYAAATGVAMRTLTNDIIAATGAQVSFQDAASAGAIGIAAGLNADQLTRLGTAAKDASIILGRDVTDSFNRLIRGVTKAEPELLDELGIILRLDDASEKYGRTIGVLGKDLTQFQKTQAVTADVLQQSEEKYSRIIAIVDPGVNKFNQLGKAFDDIVNSLKTIAVDGLTPLANLFIKFPEIAYVGLALVGKGILTAMIPALSSLGEKTEEVARKSKLAFAEATKASKAYNIALQKSLQSNPAMQKAAGTATALSQGLKAKKGSGLERLQQGKELTPRMLTAMKASAAKGTKIYKDMDVAIRRDFVLALEQMIAAQKIASAKLVTQEASTTQKLQGFWLKYKIQGIAAITTVAAFASSVGAVLSGIFFWAQMIGMVVLAGKLFYDWVTKSEPVLDETTHKLTILGERVSSLAGEYEHFAEVQKIMLEDASSAKEFFGNMGDVVGQLTSGQINMMGEQLNAAIGATFQQNLKDSTAALKALDNSFTSFMVTMNVFGNQNSFLNFLESSTRFLLSWTGIMKSATEINEEYRESLEKRLKMNAFEVVIAAPDSTQVQKDSAKFLQQQLDALNAVKARLRELGQESSKAFDAYGKILEAGARGDSISVEAFARAKVGVDEINQALKESEALFKSNKIAVTDFVRAFAGVSKEGALLDKLQAQYTALQITMADGSVDPTSGLKLEKEIETSYALVADILTAQYSTKLRMSKLDIESVKSLRGATKGQKARLKTDIDIIKNNIKIVELEAKQDVTRRQAEADSGRELRTSELQSIALNENKVELLRQQSIELERQNDFTVQLTDDIKNSFESGFSSGLSDIITGKETSLRDSITKLATSILESVADVIAKNITDTVVDFIFRKPEVSEAEIMAAALKAAPPALSASIKGSTALIGPAIKAAHATVGGLILTSHNTGAAAILTSHNTGAAASLTSHNTGAAAILTSHNTGAAAISAVHTNGAKAFGSAVRAALQGLDPERESARLVQEKETHDKSWAAIKSRVSNPAPNMSTAGEDHARRMAESEKLHAENLVLIQDRWDRFMEGWNEKSREISQEKATAAYSSQSVTPRSSEEAAQLMKRAEGVNPTSLGTSVLQGANLGQASFGGFQDEASRLRAYEELLAAGVSEAAVLTANAEAGALHVGREVSDGLTVVMDRGAEVIGRAITSACEEVAVAEGTSRGAPPYRPNKFIDGFEGNGGTDDRAFIKAFEANEPPRSRLSPPRP